MKSGWFFLSLILSTILMCWIVAALQIPEHISRTIWSLAIWVHSYPWLENTIFLVLTVSVVAYVIYSLFRFVKQLEW